MKADQDTPSTADLRDSVGIIAGSTLLGSVRRKDLEDLRPVLEWVELKASDTLVLGDIDSRVALYFVAEGRLTVSQGKKEQGRVAGEDSGAGTVTAGDVVGETTTLTGFPRVTTLTAVTSARLVRLERTSFDYYLATHNAASEELKAIVIPQFYRRQLLRVLNDMFGRLTHSMLVDIEERNRWEYIPREGLVFWQGETSDRTYFVLDGRVQVVSATGTGDPRVVEEIDVGGSVGALGVFSGGAQPASVFAVRDSILLGFAHDDFRELADRYPKLNEWLARCYAARLERPPRSFPAPMPLA